MCPSKPEHQLTLFGITDPEPIVNVASVPHRSPFRYPGGKTWLVPRIRQWLASIDRKPSVLLEPFAGGAIVGLTAAFERLVDHVVLVELDRQVAAVWQTILGGKAEWLAKEIMEFRVTTDNVMRVIDAEPESIEAEAFRTIVKNRTFHGGILAPGSSLIRSGENGRGLLSRWYPETLARRIRAIGEIKDKFTFISGDGIEVIQEYSDRSDVVMFVDPPYTVAGECGKRAGKRLYLCHEVDHERLFACCSDFAGDVLMTYDDCPDVREMASRYSFEAKRVAMKNTHHAQMTELLIGKKLDWLD